MTLTIIFFILGFIFLIKGADIMVDGSSSFAKKNNISDLVIGLTIIAFGTSAPELIVSVLASFKESTGIALGNIIGSNISNTLLILGVSAIIYPLLVRSNTIKKEIPFSLLALVVLGILVNDTFLASSNNLNILNRADGLVLLLFFVIFIYYTFGINKTENKLFEETGKDEVKVYKNSTSILMIIAGLTGLFLGGRWIVNSATDIAKYFSLSEELVGLTIVAIGTSLPELAASAMAAAKKKADMAIGNVVGSNIFNILWVLGISSLIKPIAFNNILNFDILVLLSVTIILIIFIYIGKRNILSKKEGIILIMLYVFYISFLVYRG
ncbi:MAG: calcium/sodium antiporter [Patescibacteria group bacterium]